MAFPVSYADPLYASLAATAEQQYNLPTGILNAIRLLGERSNANQVSSAGARTPYQFIPSTRAAFIKQYGIDPWADPTQATDAAAIHLSDDYKRTGSWDQAIARYYGGQHPGTAAYKYQARVGDFDNSGANGMGTSLYPVVNGVDPLAPQPPLSPVPIQGSAGPSANVSPTSPVATQAQAAAPHRGGILGALQSVFMPDPNSLWAGALRDGVFNARESQLNYQEDQAKKMLDLETTQAKLKQFLTKGEYQVVGNNVFHVKPDGSTEIISPPSTIDDKMKLIDRWRSMDANDPARNLIEALITGGANTTQAQTMKAQTAKDVANIRSRGTVAAAGVRAATNASQLPPLPPGAKVIH